MGRVQYCRGMTTNVPVTLTDEQIKNAAQELANKFMDLAYWVRTTPHDARGLIGAAEQAVVELRELAGQND
jgi:hypothetical protein